MTSLRYDNRKECHLIIRQEGNAYAAHIMLGELEQERTSYTGTRKAALELGISEARESGFIPKSYHLEQDDGRKSRKYPISC